jgi:hypothetical protein
MTDRNQPLAAPRGDRKVTEFLRFNWTRPLRQAPRPGTNPRESLCSSKIKIDETDFPYIFAEGKSVKTRFELNHETNLSNENHKTRPCARRKIMKNKPDKSGPDLAA